MADSFATVLDDCLVAISKGATLEDCLERYPKHAADLRVHLPLAMRLKQTPRHEPRAAALDAGWQEFRSRAEDMRLGRKPRFTIRMGWLRPMAIAAGLVLALLGAAGGTAYASQDALPDSPLYRVKLATEDARVWFTFDDTAKTELLLDQSNERTAEIMEMLSQGKEIPENVLTVMRERNARAVRILEGHPDELSLLTRVREQSADQEDLLLVLWGDVSESARDEYAEAVATLHNAQLRAAGIPGSVRPDDVAAGVIHITGSVEPGGDDLWLLGGVEVRLDIRTRGDTELEPGQTVSVIAARAADGRLIALDVETTDGGEPDKRFIVSGEVEEIGEGEVVVAGQRIAITSRTLLKLRLQRGQQVEISVEDVDGQAVAASVESPTADDGGAAPALLAYEGVIENEVSTGGVANSWVVGGQEFVVTPSTLIDATGGILAEGTRVRVEAGAEDGGLIAKRVTVVTGDSGEDVIRVEGVFQKGNKKTWTVSGVEVEAPPDTETPEEGSLVAFEGLRSEETLVLETLQTNFSPGKSGLTLVRGPIGSIEDGVWQVGFISVPVPEETAVIGEPQVGGRVFMWVSRDDEGELLALHVNVLDRALPQD